MCNRIFLTLFIQIFHSMHGVFNQCSSTQSDPGAVQYNHWAALLEQVGVKCLTQWNHNSGWVREEVQTFQLIQESINLKYPCNISATVIVPRISVFVILVLLLSPPPTRCWMHSDQHCYALIRIFTVSQSYYYSKGLIFIPADKHGSTFITSWFPLLFRDKWSEVCIYCNYSRSYFALHIVSIKGIHPRWTFSWCK